MMQYGDVKPATEADMGGKLENLRRLMEQPPVPEDGDLPSPMKKASSSLVPILRPNSLEM